MKNLIVFCLVVLPMGLFAQTISAQKLVSYAQFQNLKIIANDLDDKGFITKLEGSRVAGVKSEDAETASEVFYSEINSIDEIFSVVYQSPKYFIKIKSILITPKSKYIKNDNGILIYENGAYRVGVSDSQSIIAIYTQIK